MVAVLSATCLALGLCALLVAEIAWRVADRRPRSTVKSRRAGAAAEHAVGFAIACETAAALLAFILVLMALLGDAP